MKFFAAARANESVKFAGPILKRFGWHNVRAPLFHLIRELRCGWWWMGYLVFLEDTVRQGITHANGVPFYLL